MRFSLLAVSVVTLLLAGCRFMPFQSRPETSEDAPVARTDTGAEFGAYPNDFQVRIVEAFQARWPNDPIYRYRLETPRRVQLTASNRNGYAVRFRAQRPSVGTPIPDGYPWIAFFQHGRIVWVQRDSEVANQIKWYDGPQGVIEWPQAQ